MAKLSTLQAQMANSPYHPLLTYWTMVAETRNLTPNSILAYWESATQFFLWADQQAIPPTNLTRSHILQWIVAYKTKVTATTVNTRLRTLKALFNTLEQENMLPGSNPMAGVKLLKAPRPIRTPVPPESITKVLKALSRRPGRVPYRNRAILLTLWDCMLRVSELASLQTNSILWQASQIKVLGKGRKERAVPMGDKTKKVLFQYTHKHRQTQTPRLFLTRSGQPLSSPAIRQVLLKLSPLAGTHLNPHLIRHSAATWFIRQPTANLAELSKILGHEQISTTQHYLHLSPEDLVSAYQTTSPGNALKL